jgi:thiopeptide-type bacteriocin biosynthesis protein
LVREFFKIGSRGGSRFPASALFVVLPLKAWRSYQLYYHEDLNRPLLHFVRPILAKLLCEGSIDSFFFVRFGLGGPHLRLRLRARPGCIARVADEVRSAAARFLADTPSTRTLDPARIEAQTAAILASDTHEDDRTVYPDNSLVVRPYRPEVERYGGPRLLAASLDLFAVSSVAALEFAHRHTGTPRATLLATAFRLLLRQALGLCVTEDELMSHLAYGLDGWAAVSPAILAKGDQVYQSQRRVFADLFQREARAASAPPPDLPSAPAADLLTQAARALSRAIRGAPSARRRIVGVSHLHMTANRLGLINAEEAYLCRLLSRTAEDLFGSSTVDRAALLAPWRSPNGAATATPRSARDLRRQALRSLLELPFDAPCHPLPAAGHG